MNIQEVTKKYEQERHAEAMICALIKKHCPDDTCPEYSDSVDTWLVKIAMALEIMDKKLTEIEEVI